MRLHLPLAACSILAGASIPTVAAQQQPAPAGDQPPAQAQPEPPPPKGLQWQLGDWTLNLGGYVKVDLIHDLDEIGSTDSFDPRTIPTDGSEGTNTRIHARQTRVHVDLRGPTSIGPLRTFVEGDFFGSGNAFRMRHAYGTIRGLLAGQTWSTFMDEAAMPETIDFESPIAFPLIRQAQIRYTHEFDGGSYAAIALEDPASNVIAPPVPGETEEPTPDLTGRLHWQHGLGHTQLGLFGGTARFRPDAGVSDTVYLWGLNLSTKLEPFERDRAYVQLTYGPGVGRYRGGNTAAPDAGGDLEAVTVFGAMAAYEHHWSDEWRSTLTYSWGDADLPAGAPPATNELLEYLAANLIWQFSEKTWCGLEYLYGFRETLDGNDGDANRIQFAVRFDF